MNHFREIETDVKELIEEFSKLEEHQGKVVDMTNPTDFMMIHSGALTMLAGGPLDDGQSVPPLLLVLSPAGYKLYSVISLFMGVSDDERNAIMRDFLLEQGAEMYVLMSEGEMRLSADLSKPMQAVLIVQGEHRGGMFVIGTLNIDGTSNRSIDFQNSFGPVLGEQASLGEKSLLNYPRTLN